MTSAPVSVCASPSPVPGIQHARRRMGLQETVQRSVASRNDPKLGHIDLRCTSGPLRRFLQSCCGELANWGGAGRNDHSGNDRTGVGRRVDYLGFFLWARKLHGLRRRCCLS